MLDDKTSEPGTIKTCGAACTRHEMTLTSEVEQIVWLTAHTWDERCLAPKCQTMPTNNASHSVQLGTRYIKPFWGLYSDLQLDPFMLGAGDSIKVYLEWNWADRGGHDFSKDWSLVVWGEHGKVSIKHDAGYETDHFPYIERQEGDIDEGNFSVEGHLTLYEEEVIAYEESITVTDIDTDGT